MTFRRKPADGLHGADTGVPGLGLLREAAWIGGGERSGATWIEVTNPADGQLLGRVPDLGAEGAAGAVAVAKSALPAWRSLTARERSVLLRRWHDRVQEARPDLARLLTAEQGKPLAEAEGEIAYAAAFIEWFAEEARRAYGDVIPGHQADRRILVLKQAVGVVAAVTPWNFPVAIPAWKAAPALLAGNTVVLKPASQAPALALEIARALMDAGLPPGVLNIVVGEGRPFGSEVASNPAVQALSFTGSHAVGTALYQAVAPRRIRCQLEMGSKNPTLVLADADLDLAARLVAIAGFGLTGQACTATSRVIVERPVLAAFTEKLVALAKSWKVGPGLAPGVQMGPAVNAAELRGNLDAIESAKAEGADLLWGGARLTEGDLAHGFFMQPAVLGSVTPSMRIAREEVFGPVVAVIAVDSFDEALSVANGVDYGLSASLVTRDFKKAMHYAERIEAGVVKVNQISTGLALHVPFGGVKQSSTDTFREQGTAALDFYTRSKTVYLDWSA